ncbi:peptidoglycan DD-metalloendopeptidase family protein [Streptomyces genisteinicus]|uniref:Peptidoglycan DD-metalloendopeptidase family protein n=1 Tax=Streptomyces genisteinicus TaxID=2768068 RepID=A0A7H0I2Z3_9ACTN|nr:peptidoglycan DD-metalloendopeptidase family protein [Streptomyces genisteinicus]QNP67159.1 peptidoglycan DD-metalloendopeptidase family protein [Streptomyces genisteinicus]
MNRATVRRVLGAFVAATALVAGLFQAVPAAAAPAPVGKPVFQLPFACGTAWQLNTWGHDPALDIVAEGNPGSEGLPVRASAAGTVAAVYWDDGSGNTIQINHGNGWFTAYYHLRERADAYVKAGQKVTGSTRIGSIGASGAGGGWAHLHYEQRYLASGNFTYESHRRPVHFDGVEYSGRNAQWPSVTSRNSCGGQPPQPWSCPSGYVCFYSGSDGTGSVCRTDRNDPASECGLRKSYFNNGTEQPGYDHVTVAFEEGGSQCLHFGAVEGRGNFPAGGRTVTSVTWRGECP